MNTRTGQRTDPSASEAPTERAAVESRQLQLVRSKLDTDLRTRLPSTFERLSREFEEINAEDARQRGDVAYMAKWLVHASLPYREPRGNPPAWGRTNGSVSLLLQPGHVMVEVPGKKGQHVAQSIGYPFGSYPRLLLAWMATEAIRTQSRKLRLGDNLTQFMQKLGREVTGGSKGTIKTLRNQSQRLFAAQLSITTNNKDDPNWATAGFRITDSAHIEQLWLPLGDAAQRQLFQSELILTETFYDNIIRDKVPIDLKILQSLAQSALAMDIYCWLTHKYFNLGKPRLYRWEDLHSQFGSEAKSVYKFKERFTEALSCVAVLYRDAKLDVTSKGLTLFPSPTSIARLG